MLEAFVAQVSVRAICSSVKSKLRALQLAGFIYYPRRQQLGFLLGSTVFPFHFIIIDSSGRGQLVVA